MREVSVNSEALVKLEKVQMAQMWPNTTTHPSTSPIPGVVPNVTGPTIVMTPEFKKQLEQLQAKQAVKFDDGKVDWTLVPFEALEGMVQVLQFGAKKYAAWNWTEGGGFKWTRLVGSCLRHLFAWARGQDNDPESGLSHIYHAQCNLLFLAYYIGNKEKFNKDDRNVR
jgi:hypothetical protein